MRIAFLNPNLAHEYDVGTPFEKAMAGSQSAQCYLAIELARRGHEVSLFNGTKTRVVRHDVDCRPFEEFDQSLRPDVVLILNSPNGARELRQKLGPDLPIICWEHNPWNADPGYSSYLQSPASPKDYILCVSEWHRNNYISKGNLPEDRVFFVRNAVSPFFESVCKEGDSVLDTKAWPPIMAFTSTPFKGLKAALLFFKELRNFNGTATLNIFSNFDHYPPNNEHRLDRSWYDVYQSCKTMPGINYIGNVSQPQLARTLRSTLVLFFPSTLTETSSICIMEAMAAGCYVISSGLGALPEVMAGFGHVVELEDGKVLQGRHFITQALNIFELFQSKDASLEEYLQAQLAFVRANYRWSVRAAELETLLLRLVTPR